VAGHVGPIDDAQHPRGPSALADRFDWQRERRGAGDVTEKNHPRAVGDSLPEGLHPGGGIRDGQRQGLPHIPRADLAADEAPGALHSAVLVIRGEDLIRRAQVQTAGHHIDGGRGIGDVHYVVRGDAQIGGQLGPGVRQQGGRLSAEKGHRLSLQLTLPRLVRLRRPGAGTPQRSHD